MRNMINRTIIVSVLSVAMPVLAGEKGTGEYASYGPSCGAILEAYDKNQRDPNHYTALKYWLQGYVTAINYNLPDTADVLGNSDIASGMLWIVNYCKTNPLLQMSQVAEGLVRELYPKRHRTRKEAGR